MIVSFKHKGLERFFLEGDSSKLQPHQVKRIRQMLTVLHHAQVLNDMDVPGYDLHPLKGKDKGIWSIKVNGNYRITFAFQVAKVEVRDVDYVDYH